MPKKQANRFVESLGWIGSTAFMCCGIPLIFDIVEKGSSHHYSIAFIGLWLTGELCTLVYVLIKKQYPLIMNYLVNALSLIVVLFYWFFPRT